MSTQNQLPEFDCIQPADRLDHWHVKFSDGRCLEVSTAELSSNQKFLKACMRKFGRCFEPIKPAAWSRMVDDAMQRGGKL
jgi:hypothetical protein